MSKKYEYKVTAFDAVVLDSDKNKLEKILATMDDLPFLAIESDGSPFPQLSSREISPHL